MHTFRPPSCPTNRSPTCPSCPASWRRRCSPPSSTVKSSATTTRRRSTRCGCLTPAWTRSACWTCARPRCAPPCTRSAQTSRKQVRSAGNFFEEVASYPNPHLWPLPSVIEQLCEKQNPHSLNVLNLIEGFSTTLSFQRPSSHGCQVFPVFPVSNLWRTRWESLLTLPTANCCFVRRHPA